MNEAIYKIKEQTIKDIANAIRAKAGKNDLISPLDMAEEILNLSLGDIDFSQQTATEENVEEGYTFFNKYGLLSTGTGGGINFKVVGGTTQPTNPKENTIWINTDVDITGWAFDAEAPNYLSTGGVWIKTSLSSNVPFNALKKNTIMVYPFGCAQWNGSSWVTKDIKCYQNNKWTSPFPALIVNGIIQTSIYSKTSDAKVVFDGGSANGVSAGGTHSTTNGLTVSTNGYNQYVCRIFNQAIDMTNINNVAIETTISMPSTTQSYGGVFIFIISSTSGYIDIYTTQKINGFATYYRASAQSYSGTVNLDVSSLSGSYYIGVLCGTGSAYNNYSCSISNINFS